MNDINTKLLMLLVELAKANKYETELRSYPDEHRFFYIRALFIDTEFQTILRTNGFEIYGTSPCKTAHKLEITLHII